METKFQHSKIEKRYQHLFNNKRNIKSLKEIAQDKLASLLFKRKMEIQTNNIELWQIQDEFDKELPQTLVRDLRNKIKERINLLPQECPYNKRRQLFLFHRVKVSGFISPTNITEQTKIYCYKCKRDSYTLFSFEFVTFIRYWKELLDNWCCISCLKPCFYNLSIIPTRDDRSSSKLFQQLEDIQISFRNNGNDYYDEVNV